MDNSIEKSGKEENIPLIKMTEPNKGKLEYQRTLSSIKDPQVSFYVQSKE